MGFTDFLNQIGLYGETPGDKQKREQLNAAGAASSSFGNQAAGNYGQYTNRLNGALDDLQAQAQGRNLVSTEMLRQGMQQGLNGQMSMAAGASPQNQAMAARNAANNMARLGYGLSGQQAVAGMQERNQAQQMYANTLGQARGLDAQTALGGYGQAINAYSSGLNAQRDPTIASQLAGPIAGLAGGINPIFSALSSGPAATGYAALKPIAAGNPGAGGYWTPGGR